jgi:acyl-CoA synthetase (AMP-forming)/AMP-acid ligase II
MSSELESPDVMRDSANVAARLARQAMLQPNQVAIAAPLGKYRRGQPRTYRQLTFSQLELHTSSLAAGLQALGVRPGMRIVLAVRFGTDFISLVFALLKVGAVVVLVDPGMGRRNLIACLEKTEPDGFVAIPLAQAMRMLMPHRFPKAKLNVTVGKRFGILPAPTLSQLENTPSALYQPPAIEQSSPAAIIFTTGSTGPPKGVLYTHLTFNSQIDQLTEHYGIQPGGRDLSGFPLFGLFNAVMGTTTIIPDMDPTRPADVDPPRLLDAIDQWQVDQAFGSPALWTAVGRYCVEHGRRVPTLKRVFSAGAPVPPAVLESMRAAMHAEGEMFTPYGATEALPLASIESREVLEETAAKTRQGAGTCVGGRFRGASWRVIAIDDGAIATIDQAPALPPGEIGELMVAGDFVSERYVTRGDQNALHKVKDGDHVWHRMGDVGYLDERDRFWYCGRKSHRVRTGLETLFTEPCEAIFNTHPHIYRSALVGVGPTGEQTAVIIVEPWPEHRPRDSTGLHELLTELKALGRKHHLTACIAHILVHPTRLPTDIRHNSKIFREQLAPWAAKQIGAV